MTSVQSLRAGNVLLLLAGTLAAGLFEKLAGRSDYTLTLDSFSVWVASPYFLLLIPAVLIQSKRGQTALLVFALIMVVGGLFGYYDAVFLSRSSTVGLVFLFLPLWQLLIVAGVIVWVIVARIRGSAANSSHNADARQERPRAG